ncbi:MAG: rRNA pseudouridine synthase [Acholeplasmatales bacterium]|nr:rRNA pseudouridine synthase [Acholeplasmatales bacterium]
MRLLNFVKIYYGITKEKLMILYKENRILVNDKLEKLTYKLNDNDIVKIDGKIITKFPFSYYLYNKPKGILSMISDKKESYINQINVKNKLMVAGRLDKDSHGLMILTNDPFFINKISGSDSTIQKEYIVTLYYPITDEFINKMNEDIIIRNRLLKKVNIHVIDEYRFKIILSEGIYHQIRKMVIYSGNRVKDLKRIRIGKYELKDLKENEIKEFKI